MIMYKTQHYVKKLWRDVLIHLYLVAMVCTFIDCSYYFTVVRVGSTHEDISSQHHALVSMEKTEAHDTAHQVAKFYSDLFNGETMHLCIWYGFFQIMKFQWHQWKTCWLIWTFFRFFSYFRAWWARWLLTPRVTHLERQLIYTLSLCFRSAKLST